MYDFEEEIIGSEKGKPNEPLSEQEFFSSQRHCVVSALSEIYGHNSWKSNGVVIKQIEPLGKGTNKLANEFAPPKKTKNLAAILVLNKKDNTANGIDADEAEKIVRFYQLIGKMLKKNLNNTDEPAEFLEKYKEILDINDSDVQGIKDKINYYKDNPQEFKKIRNGEVKFGIAKISQAHKITAPDRTGGKSKKLLYICSVIDGEELKPEKDSSFDIQASKDQASSYSSLTIFIDSFFPPQVLKKIFGSKAKDASGNEIYDPYHPQILKDKIDSVLANEDYQYNLGVGVHLNIEGYKKREAKEEQELIIDKKVGEIKESYSKENIISIGKLHAKFLNAKIDTLAEYYNDLSKICTEGFVHGDPWHDNQKKNSFGEHMIFDLEEAGCGLHILDVAIQISDKGGIDEKTGKLNELGKAIFEAAEENFQSKGKSIFKPGLDLSPEQKEEALLKASALTSTYIEVMRAFKYVDGLYTKRNSFEQGIRSEIAMDGISPEPNIVTFSGVIKSISEDTRKK